MYCSIRGILPSMIRRSETIFLWGIRTLMASGQPCPNLVTYNTRLVAPKDLPREYSDLLDPKWKGRLGLDTSDFEWYANLKKIWGAEKAQHFLAGGRRQEAHLVQRRALLTELWGSAEFSPL